MLASLGLVGSARSAWTGLSRMTCALRVLPVSRVSSEPVAFAVLVRQASSLQMHEMCVSAAGQAMRDLTAPAVGALQV